MCEPAVCVFETPWAILVPSTFIWNAEACVVAPVVPLFTTVTTVSLGRVAVLVNVQVAFVLLFEITMVTFLFTKSFVAGADPAQTMFDKLQLLVVPSVIE